MYTAHQIADWILSKIDLEAGDSITPLKLQKLLYYCQAWHLTVFKKPLFEERIQAWAHGPVVYSQFDRFRDNTMYDGIPVNTIELDVPQFPKEVQDLLEEVMEIYGEHSGSYLEALTHQESPWVDARGDLAPHERSQNVISHEVMIAFYSPMLINA
ncbi:type II toxin-antitoxin system antitoxin SocA domain-containing protein [Pontibacter sp. G13]|uniref:Panacea domain-containing protein n=1 Tax=Pontibacter sp. G13 TaxID=3074898 RepID=UPI00288B3ABC|nr:type II toxin-antitoxin system antitoxin SocA domain-containing protein [Pontibacter sp. G13]WNJ21560.1 DUF4065 domain-containing protein [Pontibacter sp. G13]